MFDRVELVQIDSVNVLVRSQELPLFARLGPHRRDLLPAMAADGELFEYWGHEASLIPVEHHPLFRFKMAQAQRGDGMWTGLARLAARAARLRRGRARRGDGAGVRCAAGELSDGGPRKREPWWAWDDGKRALELLFWTGAVSARRRPQLRARVRPDRARPAGASARPARRRPKPTPARELLALAARALGVATAARPGRLLPAQHPEVAGRRSPSWSRTGGSCRCEVEGWKEPAYLDPDAADAAAGRRADRCCRRSTRWCGSEPAPSGSSASATASRSTRRRRSASYGYYVLPFLLGEELVGRVDLKADRRPSALLRARRRGAEPGVPDDEVAEELAEELPASWPAGSGLERSSSVERGDLADAARSRASTGAWACASDTSNCGDRSARSAQRISSISALPRRPDHDRARSPAAAAAAAAARAHHGSSDDRRRRQHARTGAYAATRQRRQQEEPGRLARLLGARAARAGRRPAPARSSATVRGGSTTPRASATRPCRRRSRRARRRRAAAAVALVGGEEAVDLGQVHPPQQVRVVGGVGPAVGRDADHVAVHGPHPARRPPRPARPSRTWSR